MPSIENLLVRGEKKFKKSSYRPWNYLEEIQKEIKEDNLQNKAPEPIVVESKPKAKANKDTVSIPKPKNTIHQIVKKQFTKLKPNEPVEKNESLLDQIFRLSGHQKALFQFIVDRCISRGELHTSAITGDILTNVTKTTLKMTKTTMQRLVSKKLIIRERGKTGRGGFYSFSISPGVREAAMTFSKMISKETDIETNKKSINNQLEIKADNQNYERSRLSSEWANIDIEPLNGIGFEEKHLLQIAMQNKLAPGMVQDSIYAFAFDLNENHKSKELKKSPLDYFMGILTKKYSPYNPPSNYETPEVKAMKEYLARCAKLEEQREETENKALDKAFQKWLETLTTEQKNALLPNDVKMLKIESPKIASLRSHFKTNIWPEERDKILNAAFKKADTIN